MEEIGGKGGGRVWVGGDIFHLKEEKDIRSAIVMAITAMLLLFEVLLLLARGHQVKLHQSNRGKRSDMWKKVFK
jgi:hypothetical protein